ncbi:MAG: ATP-binding protein [Planctomycetota bacterium]
MSGSSDLETIQNRILTEPNPFEDRAVGDPWDRAPITDVSSINRSASDTVFRLLDSLRRDRQTRIVLLLGETGAGKSHLIHRVLQQLGDGGLFVHVEPFGEASMVCKHILREIAVSLGRRRHPGAAPQIVEFAASVIRDTWKHLLISRGANKTPKGREQIEKLEGSLDYVFNSFRRQDRFKPIYEALITYLCDEAPDLDRQFLKTFFRVLHDEDRATVLDWLKGKDLEDEDLRRIGAPRVVLSEDEAFNTIRALAILSRFYRPLLICFDQNESLLWGDDDSRFQALVTTLCRVHDFTPNCLLLFTCLKQVWVHDYTRRLQKPEIARFESRPVHLEGLTTESAAELVAARMGRVFGDAEPPYPTYPFRPEFFEEFAVLGLPMARELINLCLDRIEDLRTFGRVLEITSPIQATGSALRGGEAGPWPWQQHLGKLWDSTLSDLERLREQRVEEGEIVLEGDFPLDFDEGTLRWTLGRCFHRLQEHDDRIAGCHILQVEEGLADDHKVDFVLTVEHKHGTDRVAIVVNNTRNGNRFSSHLQSVHDYLEGGGANRFFLVRNEPESEGWKRGLTLLEQVLRFGGSRLPLDSRSLVEILTFYRLCNQAQAGDLVADGKAIPRELVEQYVLETGRLSSIPLFEKVLREVVRMARQQAYDKEMESFHTEEDAESAVEEEVTEEASAPVESSAEAESSESKEDVATEAAEPVVVDVEVTETKVEIEAEQVASEETETEANASADVELSDDSREEEPSLEETGPTRAASSVNGHGDTPGANGKALEPGMASTERVTSAVVSVTEFRRIERQTFFLKTTEPKTDASEPNSQIDEPTADAPEPPAEAEAAGLAKLETAEPKATAASEDAAAEAEREEPAPVRAESDGSPSLGDASQSPVSDVSEAEDDRASREADVLAQAESSDPVVEAAEASESLVIESLSDAESTKTSEAKAGEASDQDWNDDDPEPEEEDPLAEFEIIEPGDRKSR